MCLDDVESGDIYALKQERTHVGNDFVEFSMQNRFHGLSCVCED